MRRLLRWTATVLGGLVGLTVVACAIMYVLSERVMRHTYDIPIASMTIPTDPASVAEGRRLATLRGCFHGCHGKEAEGAVMIDELMLARIVAPNLTAAVRKFSDAELVNIVRNGVRPDGRSMVIMPAEAFTFLTDEDLGRILAFLKSLPEAAGPGPRVSLGPVGLFAVAFRKVNLAADMIANNVPPPDATGGDAALGRYLARTTCAMCHGSNLRGDPSGEEAPDLRVAAAYSPEAFTRLLRTGVPLGERKLEMMREVAVNNLSQFTDAEIAALYSYLRTMPERGN